MNIPVSSEALDVAFHPSESKGLLATGLISGKVQLIDVAHTSRQTKKPYAKLWTLRPSNKSCRGIAFSRSGDSLFAISKDAVISRLDMQAGQVVNTWSNAHEAAPSRVLTIDENVLATGDDDGVVSLWDPRQGCSKPVRSYTHHFDWITSMLWCEHLSVPKKPKLSKEDEEKKKVREDKKRKRKDKQRRRAGKAASSISDEEDSEEEGATVQSSTRHRERLVVTSGDGTLSVIDPRAGQAGVEVSEDQEDELLSLASVKRDSKLVVGTQLGILSLWAPTKGLLDHVDRIPGHPSSVDAMCTLDDDTVLTGSSDGLVRVVQILPHKLLGVIADHEGMPVERLARHGPWLASIGHGSEIRLTDLAPLLDDDDVDEDDDADEEDKIVSFGVSALSGAALEGDDDEGEEGEGKKEDIDSDDSAETRQSTRPAKKSKMEKILRPVTQTVEDASAADFFADL